MSIFNAMTRMVMFAVVAVAGVAVLWEAADQAGPRDAEVVVHIREIGVAVSIDDLDFQVNSYDDIPIVCTLLPGQHLLSMSRADKTVYEQEFTIRRGEDLVLTAWDTTRPRTAEPPPTDPDREDVVDVAIPWQTFKRAAASNGGFTSTSPWR